MRKIKIYTFYTAGNEILLQKWFLPTLKDDYLIVKKEGNQNSSSGRYKEAGWYDITRQKIDFVIEAVQDSWGELFLFSDPDIQFFEATKDYLLKIYRDEDLLFQLDNPVGVLCTGFFLCKGNSKNLRFWQDVRSYIGTGDMDDQDAANCLLKGSNKLIYKIIRKVTRKKHPQLPIALSQNRINKYGIRWGFLPVEFYCGGTLTGKLWSPGRPLPIPKNILLHHANWTVGTENKIAQLQYVRNIINSRNKKNPF